MDCHVYHFSIFEVFKDLDTSYFCLFVLFLASAHFSLFVSDGGCETYSKIVRLTCTHMIMTFTRCSEGDQMLQVFSRQDTVKHRGHSSNSEGGGRRCFITLEPMALSLNLTTFLGEKACCVSECYHFLEECER